jgi:hypothetical protein
MCADPDVREAFMYEDDIRNESITSSKVAWAITVAMFAAAAAMIWFVLAAAH